MKLNNLQDKVVVVTGASSGIGKLAAEEFLKRGAMVVLAARSEEAMQTHLGKLEVDRERAISVRCDVSNYAEVRHLAQLAREHFGRIDVWVNNAGISLYGTVSQLSPDEISRVIDVNLKGEIFGTKAALEIFREQRCGNIINISSALGKGSTPLQSIYTAAKHGIVGFSSCVREELVAEGLDEIDVSVIMPASMDTPLFTHARSKLGVKPYPIPPVYHPQTTVDAIIACAVNPRPEVPAGGFGRIMTLAYRFTPGLLEKYEARTGVSDQIGNEPEPVEGNDNLFTPMADTQTVRGESGTTGDHVREYPQKHPIQLLVGVSVPLLLGSVLLRRRKPKAAKV